jgi:hypothetical protein
MSSRANNPTSTEASDASYDELRWMLPDELRALEVGIHRVLADPATDADLLGGYRTLARSVRADRAELFSLLLGDVRCSEDELPAYLTQVTRTRERFGIQSWEELEALVETMDELDEVEAELLERSKYDAELGARLAAAINEPDPHRQTFFVRTILIDEGRSDLLRRFAEHEAHAYEADERGRQLRRQLARDAELVRPVPRNGGWA